MANGITNLMRNIRKPGPQWVHEHTEETTAQRKKVVQRHGLKTIALEKNRPYANPARDLKPGRRLRVELRSIPLCDSADGMVRKGSLAYRGEEYSCPGGAIINGFAVPCWSLAHDEVLTRDQVREVAA